MVFDWLIMPTVLYLDLHFHLVFALVLKRFFKNILQDELEKSRHELEDLDLTIAQYKAVSQLQNICLNHALFFFLTFIKLTGIKLYRDSHIHNAKIYFYESTV